MSVRRPLRALLALGALGSVSACAYYNGLYNSREEERKADHLLASGDDASVAFRTVAEKAETVLTRYPKTRWRARALYLAGRGHAYAGDCDAAGPRLSEFLGLRALGPDERARATIALASCDVRAGHFTAARAALAPLLTYRRRDLSTEASLWSARAAIALNDAEGARRDLARVGTSAAAWELFAASMERLDYARAESLLVSRAREGDFREDVIGAEREFWRAGRAESAERIAALYDASRARASDKARLRVTLAGLAFAAGRDSAAERHLLAARRHTADPLLVREIVAQLLAIRVARAVTTADAEAALKSDSAGARGSPVLVHLADNVLLVRMLEQHRDLAGAAQFLAGEIARDSLSAPALAHTLFLRVLRDAGAASTMPARALLAAAGVRADSAAAYEAQLERRYPTSPWAVLARGGDPGGDAALAESDATLRATWSTVLRAYADTIAARRPRPDSTAAATSSSPGTPPTSPPPPPVRTP
jgi:hypothetical protein